jgi:alpha-D-xyloside xylohydrolase
VIEVESDAYPQRVLGEDPVDTHGVDRVVTPVEFKKGRGAVFTCPTAIVDYSWEGNSLGLVCSSKGFMNFLAQTHETKMFQFKDNGNKPDFVHLRIDLWSDHVFRVRFGLDKIGNEACDFPPVESRMLIGEADTGTGSLFHDRGAFLEVVTEAISIRIDKGTARIRAFDASGRLFWSQCKRDIFTADIFDLSRAELDGRAACFEAFDLRDAEAIYGLGERFDYVERRGKRVDFWNKDAIGTSNTRSYINVPFLMSTEGYGLFLNSSAATDWDIGTLEMRTLGFSVVDETIDYFIIHGPNPAEILGRYSRLTGFSPLPPVWSFGLWMSRNSYYSWDVVNEVARGLRARDIPCDVLHLDTAWFKDDWNCDLKFSEERFPHPEENMSRLRESGFRISLWQYNFIPPRKDNANFQEALAKGYLVKGGDGGIYAYPEGSKGSWIDDAIIDFSNPEACQWYARKIEELVRLGAATIKTDFGEGIPADGVFMAVDGGKFHNLYSLVYNSVVAMAIRKGGGSGIVWARSGTAGSQRYPIHWGGDSQCSFAGLAGTLRAALSIGLSGFPFFAHDIGGFIGRPDPELYIRWAQFGLFSSHSRCHGAGNDNSREPWTFGAEAERIFRRYAKLRYSLLPYIVEEARKCSLSGLPMVRALVIEHPKDRNVWHIEDQYYFGDSLLIAPVLVSLDETRVRTLYLPEGEWFDYWTKGSIRSRGEWIDRPVDIETMPIYVKAGTVLSYAKDRSSTEDVIGDIVKRECYGPVGAPPAEENVDLVVYS